MTRDDVDDVLICRIAFQRTLEVRTVAAGRLLFPFAMGVGVEQERFRIVGTRDTALLFRVVACAQHDVDLERHRDVAHAAYRTTGIAVVDVAVGTAFEEVFVVTDVIRVEVGRPGEVSDLRTDSVEVSFRILEFMEHVAGDHLDRADSFKVVSKPLQQEGGDHFALTYSTVAVDLDHEYATVVLFDHKQRAVTRNTSNLFDLLVDDRQTRFLDIAEVVGLRLERRNDRLDVTGRTLDVEISDLWE